MTRTRGSRTQPAMGDLARAVAEALAASGWGSTGRLQLLDLDVAVASDDPALVDLVAELYAPTVTEGRARHVLALGAAEVDGRPGCSVTLDGVLVARSTAPSVAFSHLLFEANRRCIDGARGAVVLHAAAADVDGRAVILAGGMGAGKSTLVAGLVRAGAGYLTDEAVAIDRASGLVRPYAKPVSLGSPPAALGPVTWRPAAAAAPYVGTSGIVPATALSSRPPAGPVVPGIVVLPRYFADAETVVERLTGADALTALAAHTFHLERPGMLRALAALLGGRPCFRLTSGDLDRAVDAVLDLAAAERRAIGSSAA